MDDHHIPWSFPRVLSNAALERQKAFLRHIQRLDRVCIVPDSDDDDDDNSYDYVFIGYDDNDCDYINDDMVIDY